MIIDDGDKIIGCFDNFLIAALTFEQVLACSLKSELGFVAFTPVVKLDEFPKVLGAFVHILIEYQ